MEHSRNSQRDSWLLSRKSRTFSWLLVVLLRAQGAVVGWWRDNSVYSSSRLPVRRAWVDFSKSFACIVPSSDHLAGLANLPVASDLIDKAWAAQAVPWLLNDT